MAGENKQITTLIITYENGNQSLAQVDSDIILFCKLCSLIKRLL